MFYHILEVELSNGSKLTCFKSDNNDTPWQGEGGEGYCYRIMHEILGLDCQFYPFKVFQNELKCEGYDYGCADGMIKTENFEVKLINRDHIISISSICDFEIADGKYY
jgi:hypothetical protein